MVKNEVKEIIRKKLRVVKDKKDKELFDKSMDEFPDEIKEANSIAKKINRIKKQEEKLSENREVLYGERKSILSKVERKSKGNLRYDSWGHKLILNSHSEFDVSVEFNKIEEELILSDDKGGTLKKILDEIAKM